MTYIYLYNSPQQFGTLHQILYNAQQQFWFCRPLHNLDDYYDTWFWAPLNNLERNHKTQFCTPLNNLEHRVHISTCRRDRYKSRRLTWLPQPKLPRTLNWYSILRSLIPECQTKHSKAFPDILCGWLVFNIEWYADIKVFLGQPFHQIMLCQPYRMDWVKIIHHQEGKEIG